MLKYHIYFFILKAILCLQFILILAQKESVNSVYYLTFELIFNLSLGLFLCIFFTAEKFRDVDYYDRFIISAAGSFLIFNAMIGSLPKLLSRFGIHLPSWWPVQMG